MGINKYWEESKYIDLWSLNHVVSGIVLALILSYLGVSFGWSLAIASILFVGWEILENFIGIQEYPTNIMTDIIFDFAGFFGAMYYLHITGERVPMVIIPWIIIFICLSIWGFMAYKMRTLKSRRRDEWKAN